MAETFLEARTLILEQPFRRFETHVDRCCAIARRLREAGVDVDLADTAGVTALELAASRGDKRLVRCLLELGARPPVRAHEAAAGRRDPYAPPVRAALEAAARSAR